VERPPPSKVYQRLYPRYGTKNHSNISPVPFLIFKRGELSAKFGLNFRHKSRHQSSLRDLVSKPCNTSEIWNFGGADDPRTCLQVWYSSPHPTLGTMNLLGKCLKLQCIAVLKLIWWRSVACRLRAVRLRTIPRFCHFPVCSVLFLLLPLPSKNPQRRHYVFAYAVRLAVVRPLTLISRATISLYLLEGFTTKLGTNIHHVSAHCWKGFQGQKSEVKVIARWNALFRQRDDTHRLTSVVPAAEAYLWRAPVWRRGDLFSYCSDRTGNRVQTMYKTRIHDSEL